jgi:ADP-ribose/FAD diphosphatase
MLVPIKHCNNCGALVDVRIPPGEDRERFVCTECQMVHYQNPKLVVGTLVEHEGQLLICRRAISPRRDYWTLPAGFHELGESTMAGAIRETHEEAGALVTITAPFAHFDIPHIGQAYVFYRAVFDSLGYHPGPESLEVKLIDPDDIPWKELAFDVVRVALELYVDDRKLGVTNFHGGSITVKPGAPRDLGYCELTDRLTVAIG